MFLNNFHMIHCFFLNVLLLTLLFLLYYWQLLKWLLDVILWDDLSFRSWYFLAWSISNLRLCYYSHLWGFLFVSYYFLNLSDFMRRLFFDVNKNLYIGFNENWKKYFRLLWNFLKQHLLTFLLYLRPLLQVYQRNFLHFFGLPLNVTRGYHFLDKYYFLFPRIDSQIVLLFILSLLHFMYLWINMLRRTLPQVFHILSVLLL